MKKYICKNVVALREKPDNLTQRVDEALYGMDFEILEEKDNFYKVKMFYGYIGYVKKENTVEYKGDYKEKMIMVQTCDVMRKPNIKSEIIMTLTRGAYLLTTEKEENKFIQVKLLDGSLGWVKWRTFIKNEGTLGERLVKNAMLYLGVNYRWGGKSPLGIDCSGLTFMSYLMEDIIIYRDAKIVEGYKIVKKDIENIELGDLIFFPGHVAMYIGNNKYIHSNLQTGDTRINSLDEKDKDYREDLKKSITAIGGIIED